MADLLVRNIPDELKARLADFAEREERSMAWVVRRALEVFLGVRASDVHAEGVHAGPDGGGKVRRVRPPAEPATGPDPDGARLDEARGPAPELTCAHRRTHKTAYGVEICDDCDRKKRNGVWT